MLRLSLTFFASVICALAQVPEAHRGNWILVNGILVLEVGAESMTLRNTGAEAELVPQDDGSYQWQFPDQSQNVRFEEGKLFLQSAQPGPKWLEYVEFRRADAAIASEVIEAALRQQNQAMASFEEIRRSSQEKAVLNNLRQLSAAADQYYLEHGVTSVKFEDLVGPGTYIKRITPVDGEDYSKLKFEQGGGPLIITTASGIEVSYESNW